MARRSPNEIRELLQSESVSLKNLKVFITTWNMGNAEAKGLEHIFAETTGKDKYDIIAIGLQESTYSIKGSPAADCIQHLGSQLKQILSADYFLVEHCYRAQLQLYVFARLSLYDRIHNIEKSIENTGFLHVFPNKGGLLTTLEVDGTRLAFISCHLAAHEGVKYCENRNASIVEILGGVRAGDKDIDVTEQFHHIFWMGDMNYRLTFDPTTPANTKKLLQTLNDEYAEKQEKAVVGVNDVAVDVGASSDPLGMDDDEEDEPEPATSKSLKLAHRKKIMEMIVKEQWEELLKLDELNRELSSGRILNDFKALQPAFPPTFKRSRQLQISLLDAKTAAKEKKRWNLTSQEELSNSSSDDQLLSGVDDAAADLSPESDPSLLSSSNVVNHFYHRKRIPSFTDRILFKSMSTFQDRLQPLFFTSCEQAISSDHKPVKAGFLITLTEGKRDIFIDRALVNGLPKKFPTATTTSSYPKFLRLKCYDLQGFDLEEMDAQIFGGGSDPYIVFKTDPVPLLLSEHGKLQSTGNGVRSKVIKHNLNPIWNDAMYLDLASLDLEGMIRNGTLIMEVWDEDTFNADDLIGVVTFPFRDILHTLFGEQKPFFAFDTIIRSNSEVMGRMSGKIALDLPGMRFRSFEDVVQMCQHVATIRPGRTPSTAIVEHTGGTGVRQQIHASTSTGERSSVIGLSHHAPELIRLSDGELLAVQSTGCGCVVQ